MPSCPPVEHRVGMVLEGPGAGKRSRSISVLSLLLSSLLQVGPKGCPSVPLISVHSRNKEMPQGSHQTVQGATREKLANKKTHFITQS